MKKLLFGLFAGCLLFQIHAAELKWETDLPTALAQAKAEKKAVFLDFTGSDWCPACILFHKQSTASSEFADYAQKNLVLVEVDFPNNKPQSDTLKTANKALQKKYNIEGFPTLILVNADEKELGRQLGYDSDGINDLIKKLKQFSKE